MVYDLISLYEKVFGQAPAVVKKLSGDGSNRVYYRMSGDAATVIGAEGTSLEENRAFCVIAKQFEECGIDAPRVFAVSHDEMCYLLQDLGDETLFARMKGSRTNGCFASQDVDALCAVMSLLPDIQYKIGKSLDFSICHPVEEFDKRTVMWDLNYFKYCFLKGVGVEFDESLLETEFERLADILLEEENDTFMYRDFQSRNIMWHQERPWFIDFQGGRKGPFYYDVASFVWQARAKYTADVVEKMLDAYMNSLAKYRKVSREEFMRKLCYFRLFRLLQTLGTYGYRGLYERKKKFVESIPAALSQLQTLFGEMQCDFPVLQNIISKVVELPRFVREDTGELVVDVFSFSYHRGIPEDYSGNGGGFVFDCRAIHNPGRYEPYKNLNGMDAPVIKFLEEESDIKSYLDNVYSLVDNMVDNYMQRGFTHVQICFGCTGGQHRSVYCAEHTAKHIAQKFHIKVNVNHLMQNVNYTIEKGDCCE
ncbi:MAG: phosphotransferase [Bacteroidaceae bacterium]|nr:phosphotransferase [Bacteroidaceae bacterium]